MFKKIFIFIMIFAIVFVFVFETNIAYATTATFGAIYGTELGSEILAIVLASLAVGVTYNSLVEVEQLFKASELIDWDEILGSAPDPPPGGGHNPNKKLITALLLGVPGGAFLSSIFGDLISWFQDLGATEGENTISDDIQYNGFINGYAYELNIVGNNTHDLKVYITINGGPSQIIANAGASSSSGYKYSVETLSIKDIVYHSPSKVIVELSYRFWSYPPDGPRYLLPTNVTTKNPVLNIGTDEYTENPYPIHQPITFNVKPNSSVITNTLPNNIPQPDISNLPGIETITTSDGQEKVIYPGNFEDLVNDIVNNITFEDIKNIIPGTNSYIITETQEGLNINTGQESPFPDVNTDPIEDSSIFQGTTIGLLQSIINWLNLIRNDILNFFNKLFEVPSDLNLDLSNLKLNGFQERFPFSIPWDIAAAISVFSSSPSEPDLTIDMDTNYFTINHEIDISSISLPLRFARYAASVFFILYLANKTRDLIKW